MARLPKGSELNPKVTQLTVGNRILLALRKRALRFTEIKELARASGISLLLNLSKLQREGLVKKEGKGLYALTDKGRAVVLSLLMQVSAYDEDTEYIKEVLLRSAVRKVYYLLSDIAYIVARRKEIIKDCKEIHDELSILLSRFADLYEYYEGKKPRKPMTGIDISDIVAGGFVWGPRVVSMSLNERVSIIERLIYELDDDNIGSPEEREYMHRAIHVAREVINRLGIKKSDAEETNVKDDIMNK